MQRRKRTDAYLKGLAEMRARALGELDRYQERVAEAQRDLEACDTAVVRDYPTIDPKLIEAIRAWRHFGGRRGALLQTLSACLEARYPRAATTFELVAHAEAELSLSFESPAARRQWVTNSVLKTLKRFVERGLAKRLDDRRGSPGKPGIWQWAPREGVDFYAQAASEGIRVELFPDEPSAGALP
jgi:hypothetical protein